MKSVVWLVVLLCLGTGCSHSMRARNADVSHTEISALAAASELPVDAPMDSIRPDAREVSAIGEGVPVVRDAAALRKVIYTARMVLQVTNMAAAMESIGGIIKENQGFIQNATLTEITFRVPPERFEAVMGATGGLGDILERDVRTRDVTAEFYDVQLRMDVAEQSRQRLKEILHNAGAVKDVLEVERDIRRLTEEIEQMKGSMQLLQDQLEMATISVKLRERAIVEVKARKIAKRFGWMAWTGIDQVMAETNPRAETNGGPWLWRLVHGRVFELEAPAAFVALRRGKRGMVLSSPEDFRLRAVSYEVNEPAELSYWAEALRHELQANRGYGVQKAEEVAMQDKRLKGMRLRTQAQFGGETWVYDVWLIQRVDNPEHLLVVEFAALEKDAATLRAQAEGVIAKAEYPIARAMWRGI